MNKITYLFIVGSCLIGVLFFSHTAVAQDSAPIKWTVVDSPNHPPVSTVSDQAAAPSANAAPKVATKKSRFFSPEKDDRKSEMEKAVKVYRV